MAGRSRDELGRFVSERDGGGGGLILLIVAGILLFVLLLKGLGLLQVWTGIDPYGITVSIDATSLASVGLFVYVLNQYNSVKKDLKKDFKKVDENLTKIEKQLATLEERTKKM